MVTLTMPAPASPTTSIWASCSCIFCMRSLHLLGLFHQVTHSTFTKHRSSRLEIRHPAPGCGFICPKGAAKGLFQPGASPGTVFSPQLSDSVVRCSGWSTAPKRCCKKLYVGIRRQIPAHLFTHPEIETMLISSGVPARDPEPRVTSM